MNPQEIILARLTENLKLLAKDFKEEYVAILKNVAIYGAEAVRMQVAGLPRADRLMLQAESQIKSLEGIVAVREGRRFNETMSLVLNEAVKILVVVATAALA